MAIVGSNLTSGNGTAASTYNTASVSPSANALVVFWIHIISGTVTLTSVTGAGMTWVPIGSFVDATNNLTTTAVRALSASPTPGALTINLSGNATARYSVDQFTGVDTSGTNGSGAIVANTGSLTSNTGATVTGATTGITKSLAALKATDNVSAGFAVVSVALTPTVGAGYTILGGAGTRFASEYKIPGSTTVNFTWASTSLTGELIALEIARDPSDGQDWFGTDPTVTFHPLPNVGY